MRLKLISISIILTLLIVPAIFLISCTAPEPAPPPPPNRPPEIHYITAPTETLPSTKVELKCVATDADGDNLTYTWSAGAGEIIGNSDTAIWKSPETAGEYTIDVIASDESGGTSKKSTTIKVNEKPNTAPVISLKVTVEGNKEIIVKPGDTEAIWVQQWSVFPIECKAEDPDGDTVNFLWSASGGKLEGEGNLVKYTATERGDFVVIVTAVDSKGASTKGAVYFHVPCCGAGSFGQKGT